MAYESYLERREQLDAYEVERARAVRALNETADPDERAELLARLGELDDYVLPNARRAAAMARAEFEHGLDAVIAAHAEAERRLRRQDPAQDTTGQWAARLAEHQALRRAWARARRAYQVLLDHRGAVLDLAVQADIARYRAGQIRDLAGRRPQARQALTRRADRLEATADRLEAEARTERDRLEQQRRAFVGQLRAIEDLHRDPHRGGPVTRSPRPGPRAGHGPVPEHRRGRPVGGHGARRRGAPGGASRGGPERLADPGRRPAGGQPAGRSGHADPATLRPPFDPTGSPDGIVVRVADGRPGSPLITELELDIDRIAPLGARQPDLTRVVGAAIVAGVARAVERERRLRRRRWARPSPAEENRAADLAELRWELQEHSALVRERGDVMMLRDWAAGREPTVPEGVEPRKIPSYADLFGPDRRPDPSAVPELSARLDQLTAAEARSRRRIADLLERTGALATPRRYRQLAKAVRRAAPGRRDLVDALRSARELGQRERLRRELRPYGPAAYEAGPAGVGTGTGRVPALGAPAAPLPVSPDPRFELQRESPRIVLDARPEGAVPPGTLLEIARRNGVDLGADTAAQLADRYSDPQDVSRLVRQALRTESDFRQVMLEYARTAAEQGVVYTEMTFAPADAVSDGVDWRAVFNGYTSAIAEAAERYGIVVRLTPEISTGTEPAVAEEVARWAVAYRDRGVVGFGLGGEISADSLAPYAEVFRIARAGGLGLVVQVGESAGPAGIRAALEWDPVRIRNGVQAAEDPELTAELARRGVVLDVTITSDGRTGGVPDPVQQVSQLVTAGVLVSVNSDGPASSRTHPRQTFDAGVAGVLGGDEVRVHLRRLAADASRPSSPAAGPIPPGANPPVAPLSATTASEEVRQLADSLVVPALRAAGLIRTAWWVDRQTLAVLTPDGEQVDVRLPAVDRDQVGSRGAHLPALVAEAVVDQLHPPRRFGDVRPVPRFKALARLHQLALDSRLASLRAPLEERMRNLVEGRPPTVWSDPAEPPLSAYERYLVDLLTPGQDGTRRPDPDHDRLREIAAAEAALTAFTASPVTAGLVRAAALQPDGQVAVTLPDPGPDGAGHRSVTVPVPTLDLAALPALDRQPVTGVELAVDRALPALGRQLGVARSADRDSRLSEAERAALPDVGELHGFAVLRERVAARRAAAVDRAEPNEVLENFDRLLDELDAEFEALAERFGLLATEYGPAPNQAGRGLLSPHLREWVTDVERRRARGVGPDGRGAGPAAGSTAVVPAAGAGQLSPTGQGPDVPGGEVAVVDEIAEALGGLSPVERRFLESVVRVLPTIDVSGYRVSLGSDAVLRLTPVRRRRGPGPAQRPIRISLLGAGTFPDPANLPRRASDLDATVRVWLTGLTERATQARRWTSRRRSVGRDPGSGLTPARTGPSGSGTPAPPGPRPDLAVSPRSVTGLPDHGAPADPAGARTDALAALRSLAEALAHGDAPTPGGYTLRFDPDLETLVAEPGEGSHAPAVAFRVVSEPLADAVAVTRRTDRQTPDGVPEVEVAVSPTIPVQDRPSVVRHAVAQLVAETLWEVSGGRRPLARVRRLLGQDPAQAAAARTVSRVAFRPEDVAELRTALVDRARSAQGRHAEYDRRIGRLLDRLGVGRPVPSGTGATGATTDATRDAALGRLVREVVDPAAAGGGPALDPDETEKLLRDLAAPEAPWRASARRQEVDEALRQAVDDVVDVGLLTRSGARTGGWPPRPGELRTRGGKAIDLSDADEMIDRLVDSGDIGERLRVRATVEIVRQVVRQGDTGSGGSDLLTAQILARLRQRALPSRRGEYDRMLRTLFDGLSAADLDGLRNEPLSDDLRRELVPRLVDRVIVESLPLLGELEVQTPSTDPSPGAPIRLTRSDGQEVELPGAFHAGLRDLLRSRLAEGQDLSWLRAEAAARLGAAVAGRSGDRTPLEGALVVLGRMHADSSASQGGHAAALREAVEQASREILAEHWPNAPQESKLTALAVGLVRQTERPKDDPQVAELRSGTLNGHFSSLVIEVGKVQQELSGGAVPEYAALVHRLDKPVRSLADRLAKAEQALRARAEEIRRAQQDADEQVKKAREKRGQDLRDEAREKPDAELRREDWARHDSLAWRRRRAADAQLRIAEDDAARYKRRAEAYDAAADAAKAAGERFTELVARLPQLDIADATQRSAAVGDFLHRVDAASREYRTYQARLEQAMPRVALHATVADGDLPFRRALAKKIHDMLAESRSDAAPTAAAAELAPERWERDLLIRWRDVTSDDGTVFQVGSDAEVHIRFVSPDLPVEVPQPAAKMNRMILGQLPQHPPGTRGLRVGVNQRLGLRSSVTLSPSLIPPGWAPWWDAVREVLGDWFKLRVGAGFSRRFSTFGKGDRYALPGQVSDNRLGGVLVDVAGHWEIRVRTAESLRRAQESGRGDGWSDWAQLAEGAPDDPLSARVWVPHPYTEPPPTNVVRIDPKERDDRFPEHSVTGLTGLPRAYNAILSTLHHGNRKVGDTPARQLSVFLFEEYPARLAQAANQPYGLSTVLTDDGKPVARVMIRTVPDRTKAKMVGRPILKYYLERLRTAFANTAGGSTAGGGRVAELAPELSIGRLVEGTRLEDIAGRIGELIARVRAVPRFDGSRGWSDGFSAEFSNTDVSDRRATGYTQGYRIPLRHEIVVHRFDKEGPTPIHLRPVPGEALFRMTESDAYRYGLPVAAEAVQRDPDGTVRLRDAPVSQPPPGRDAKPPVFLGNGPGQVPGSGPGIAWDLTGVDGPDGLQPGCRRN